MSLSNSIHVSQLEQVCVEVCRSMTTVTHTISRSSLLTAWWCLSGTILCYGGLPNLQNFVTSTSEKKGRKVLMHTGMWALGKDWSAVIHWTTGNHGLSHLIGCVGHSSLWRSIWFIFQENLQSQSVRSDQEKYVLTNKFQGHGCRSGGISQLR